MQTGFVSFTEVKQAVSLEAVLARYELLAGMAKKGRNLAGACPFCKGKSARQFQVNLAKNAWYCFGCKQGGNVLDFVARKESVSVRTAAVRLDSWFELGLREEEAPRPTPPAAPAEAPRALMEETLPRENPPLTFTLKTLDPHHEELAALGFQPSTIAHFGAGYCTKGLLKGRLATPVHNGEGELVAYAGLAVDGDEAPRYLFPPKFHPSLEVFGLDRLAEAEEGGPLYLAPEIEGVLRLFEGGFAPAVGLFDGSLSEEQEEALRAALTLHGYEQVVLVGEGFPDRTIAHLARHAAVTWVPDLAVSPDAAELAGAFSSGREGT